MQEIMQFVSRHPVLSIAWIGLLAAVLFTTFKGLTSKIKVITRGEATRLINKEDAVVVDLRQRDDFRKGHIAGAINLLPAEIKANNVGELEKHKAQPIIVVDATGMQAQESASALHKAGFENVTVLKEGISGWSGKIFLWFAVNKEFSNGQYRDLHQSNVPVLPPCKSASEQQRRSVQRTAD